MLTQKNNAGIDMVKIFGQQFPRKTKVKHNVYMFNNNYLNTWHAFPRTPSTLVAYENIVAAVAAYLPDPSATSLLPLLVAHKIKSVQ